LQKNTPYQQLSDQELLQAYYQSGDQQLLGGLLQRYTLLLFGVCMKYLKNEEQAKDGVQQVFLKALQEIPKYKIAYFKSWLYMVAKNHCLMQLRDSGKLVPEALNEKHSKQIEQTTEVAEKRDKEALLQLIEKGLETLNKEQKECLTLFYLHKKSYQEISNINGYTILQIKSYIQNGKRNIKLWVERNTINTY
jgi:RNA polymerase sigma factor (sigma-70 family)